MLVTHVRPGGRLSQIHFSNEGGQRDILLLDTTRGTRIAQTRTREAEHRSADSLLRNTEGALKPDRLGTIAYPYSAMHAAI